MTAEAETDGKTAARPTQRSGLAKELQREIDRRRTFAIISHPDAGKTTLTEKLLLFGGAIQMAGSVKSRKAARHATSDWMALEKERGISVTAVGPELTVLVCVTTGGSGVQTSWSTPPRPVGINVPRFNNPVLVVLPVVSEQSLPSTVTAAGLMSNVTVSV